jgi:uncharacterized Zn finger protein
MKFPHVAQSTIQSYATANSVSRGEDYYQSGAVSGVTQRDDLIQSEVEGSEFNPYRVSIQFDANGITAAQCTCPYDYEGWCKHIVATLLTCIRHPKRITDRPTLVQLLDRLDPLQTQHLIQSLVTEKPDLIDAIDRHVTRLTIPPSPPKKTAQKPRRTAIDPQPFRRQVKQIVRDGLRYLEDGYDDDPTTESLQNVIAQAQELTEQGQPEYALTILEAIADTLSDEWDELSSYGLDSDDVTTALDAAFTDAILSCELEKEQKTNLQAMLSAWQDSFDRLEMSQAALQQGWDYPPLQRVLQGEITEQGAWEGESPDYADDLALIRLQILDRQGRDQEYLHLAEAEGQTVQHLNKLVELGEIDAVMEVADEVITTPDEAFAIAQTLREAGWITQALAIAQGGLLVPSREATSPFKFATWTAEFAESLGERQTALEARIIAFKAQPAFQNYRQIESLAGEAWTTIQPDLIQTLRQSRQWEAATAKVDIYLHEGLIEDAIRSVQTYETSYYTGLVHRVMEAAVASKPEWVIEEGKRRAEPIMDQKKNDRYSEAVQWLKLVRLAYLQLGQKTQWAEYRLELVQTHARKPKLMGLFNQLGT